MDLVLDFVGVGALSDNPWDVLVAGVQVGGGFSDLVHPFDTVAGVGTLPAVVDVLVLV